jgi:hypothetical protein
MFLLYHSEGRNICEMVLHECYVNDLHTTTCSGMLGHHTSLTVQKWLTFIGKYIREWESARTNVWSSDVPFDPELFDQYYTMYNRCTCIFLTKVKDTKRYFEPALCDMYEAGSSGGTRIQAVSYYN